MMAGSSLMGGFNAANVDIIDIIIMIMTLYHKVISRITGGMDW